jgi:hypothetical protein
MPSDIEREILTPLQTEDWPEVSGLVLPYYLQVVEAEEGFGYWLGLIPVVILLAVAVYILVAVVIVTVNPKRHDIFRDLARFGVPLAKVAEKIEADFRLGVVKIGAFEFGKVFFVRRSAVAFQAMLYRDLIWARVQIVEERHRGMKPVVHRTMMFSDKYGTTIKWKLDEQEQQQILRLIGQRAPWAFVGDDPAYAKMWARDRKAMIEQVERQRARLRDDRETRREEPQAEYELAPLVRR